VSRTLIDQVQREKTAVLVSELSEDERFKKAESLAQSQVQSIMCLPLLVGDRLTGILYLDSLNQQVRFEKDDLELLTAIASIAAPALENARYLGGLEAENRRILEDVGIEHNMIGESPPMRDVYQFITKAAPADSTVLIYGESGTGKELAARAIHRNSLRAQKPFVKIDCTTLTENLLESELFGHEKGAFTGAIAQKKGKLEIADRGTVFLDELGELPLPLQSKLLRVLQDREFERVGGTRTIPVDVRMIAATNRDLGEEMNQGRFRQDLYYRLNVISVTLPPLRERREDIPLLANYFATKFSKKVKRRVRGISAKAIHHLRSYDWPGNVRELENTIERAIVLGSTESILPEDLAENVLETQAASHDPDRTTFHEALAEKKKQLIFDAMTRARGSYTEAAKRLGLHPNYLHRLIRNLDIKDELKNL
jgi:Nif-specific regulatory protein